MQECDTQKEGSGNTGDLTQEIIYSHMASPVNPMNAIDQTASNSVSNFRSFLQAELEELESTAWSW